MTISRGFGITFALAVVCEVVRFALGGERSVVDGIAFGLGYALLVALGFMLAHGGFGYATAFANTLPFVLLWFVVGFFNLTWSQTATPAGWTAHDQEGALWGYVIATVMFLPLAFGASAFGVWLGRVVGRRGPPSSNAA